MNSFGRLILTAVLATALALSACGRKGDPIRPGSDDDPKKQTTN